MKFEGKIKEKLARYLLKNVEKTGASADSNRLTALFFALSGLDLINSLDSITDERRKEIIDWIYKQQLCPNDESDFKSGKFGFGSGVFANGLNSKFNYCNMAMTYCALVSLIILGDDLDRIHRAAIIRGLKEYQKCDGRFVQALIEEEDDLRITYCAAAICFILQDWSSVDKNKMVSFIQSCQSYEKGYGSVPGMEAHGGSSFCAIASLYLMGRFDILSDRERDDIVEWCLHRQIDGFQGRPQKDPDTCYSFWIGATLSLMDSFQFVNDEENCQFLCSTLDDLYGGFGKYPDTSSDIMHTYFGIAAFALRLYNRIVDECGDLQSMFPALNISHRAYRHLEKVQKSWQ